MQQFKALFLFILLHSSVFAQQIEWKENGAPQNVGDKLSYLEDPKGNFSFDQVSSDSFAPKFKPSDKVILNFGFTESYYWLKFTVNNTTREPLLLEIAHAFLPVTELYYRDSAGKEVKMVAGYKIPLNKKIEKNHFQVFPLPAGLHDYYVKVLSNSHPLPVRIFNASAYEIKTYKQRLVYGFYLGFMFFVILSNLFFYFSLRNRLYLLYSFTVFIYICYAAAVMDGFVVYLFPHVDLMFWYITIPTIGVPVQMIYCLLFLEAHKYVPRLARFTWYLIGYFVLYFFAKLYMPLTVVLAINTVNALISFFMMGLIGVRVGKRGNKLGYYFALAYFIYFLLVLTEATYIQTGNPPYFAEFSHVGMATLIEAFILSYLLSKRFEWEKAEIERAKLDAQLQLVDTTLENERIVREQNVLLEKEVTKRTSDLQKANIELNVTLKKVDEERQKSDELLLNILPAITAQELKENGMAKAQTYESVSVIFTDFKDFTESSENVSPEQLVSDLNQCFSEFDRIVRRYNLEKIKTIGDAYMAAGGLPTANDTHPVDTVNAAMDMQEFIREWKKKQEASGKVAWDLRIGIHTGPLVSGVVGMHKFSYDIWGDTVNTASRMETASEPGKVNISKSTHELVKHRFTFTHRGKIMVKGKGDVDMYFVEARK